MTSDQWKFFTLGWLFAWAVRGAVICVRAALEERR